MVEPHQIDRKRLGLQPFPTKHYCSNKAGSEIKQRQKQTKQHCSHLLVDCCFAKLESHSDKGQECRVSFISKSVKTYCFTLREWLHKPWCAWLDRTLHLPQPSPFLFPIVPIERQPVHKVVIPFQYHVMLRWMVLSRVYVDSLIHLPALSSRSQVWVLWHGRSPHLQVFIRIELN